MKKFLILLAVVSFSIAAKAQKAKLDEHYKAKKAAYQVAPVTSSKQISGKEAMKMDVVKYNRTINPEHITEVSNTKFMARSKKEQMKMEVVKIDNRKNPVNSNNIAIAMPLKDSSDMKEKIAEE